jgi:GntR family transcriptional regulator/MocR family aminotransferase
MAIWVNISKLVEGQPLEHLHNKDSTLSMLYTGDQVIPIHLCFGFGAINEIEITQSIEKLSKILTL